MVHYYRRLIIALLLGILVLVPSTNVLADDPEVKITVSAYTIGNPDGLILTYISDYEVGVEWTKPPGAVNVMIRAKYGSYPEDLEDGYLVYYGEEESCSDTEVNLDNPDEAVIDEMSDTPFTVYYRVWSQDGEGAWSPMFAEGNIEGVGMLLIALVVLGLGLLGLAFAFRQMLLAFMAGFVFIGLSVVGWTNRVETYDIYGIVAIIGILLVLVAFVCGFLVQHRAAEESFRSQRRDNKEFPPRRKLSEEEEYSELLDREIAEGKSQRRPRRPRFLG